MKQIIVYFLTKKGEQAYEQVIAAGDKESWTNKQISRMVAKDEILSKEPLSVRIKIKIPWLADKINMDQCIIQGLEKQGCTKGKDFKIGVD